MGYFLRQEPLAKALKSVTPTKAGGQHIQITLDSRLRGSDKIEGYMSFARGSQDLLNNN